MPLGTNEEFKPKIVAFCCNWCSYAGADLAGSSRLAYPADVKIIRVPCSCVIVTCAVVTVSRVASTKDYTICTFFECS